MDAISNVRANELERFRVGRGNLPMNVRFADHLEARLRNFSFSNSIPHLKRDVTAYEK